MIIIIIIRSCHVECAYETGPDEPYISCPHQIRFMLQTYFFGTEVGGLEMEWSPCIFSSLFVSLRFIVVIVVKLACVRWYGAVVNMCLLRWRWSTVPGSNFVGGISFSSFLVFSDLAGL